MCGSKGAEASECQRTTGTETPDEHARRTCAPPPFLLLRAFGYNVVRCVPRSSAARRVPLPCASTVPRAAQAPNIRIPASPNRGELGGAS